MPRWIYPDLDFENLNPDFPIERTLRFIWRIKIHARIEIILIIWIMRWFLAKSHSIQLNHRYIHKD